MTLHVSKIGKESNVSEGPDGPLNLFDKAYTIWWPHRSFAKAWLSNQSNTYAYLEETRKLMDETQQNARKEQDLSLELLRKTFEALASNDHQAMPSVSEMTAMFERSITSVGEFWKAWMNAQMHALGAMNLQDSNAKTTPKRRPAEAA